MEKIHHLCYLCKHSKREVVESAKVTYVSYACKFKNKNIDYHNIVIRLPQTNHVIECPRFKKISFLERLKRIFLWRWL